MLGGYETGWIDVGSVAIGGYSRVTCYLQVTNFTDPGGDPLQPWVNRAGVGVLVAPVWGAVEARLAAWTADIEWTSGTYPYWYPTFATASSAREALSPAIRLYVRGWSDTPQELNLPSTISCLASVGIYVRNE